MKITIILTGVEVTGVKAYLKELNGEAPTKRDVVEFVSGLVNAMNSPKEAVSDYIRQAEEARSNGNP